MIQPASAPVVPGLPALGELLSGSVIEGADPAEFAALLAVRTATAAPPQPAAQTAPANPPAAAPEAPPLPESGKPLPVGLPVAAPSGPGSDAAAIELPHKLPSPAASASTFRPASEAEPLIPLAVEPSSRSFPGSGTTRHVPAKPEKEDLRAQPGRLPAPDLTIAPGSELRCEVAEVPDGGETVVAVDAGATPATEPVRVALPGSIVPLAVPVTAPAADPGGTRESKAAPPVAVRGQPGRTVASAAPPPPPASDRPAPAGSHLAVPVRPPPGQGREAQAQDPQPAARPIQPAVTSKPVSIIAALPALPRAASTIEFRLALPATVAAPQVAESNAPPPAILMPGAGPAPATAAAAKAIPPQPIGPDLVPPAAAPTLPESRESAPPPLAGSGLADPLAPPGGHLAAPAQPLPVSAASAPVLPAYDFAQLIDRLTAARELAQPQGFQIAVQHGEFGPIELRFRHEGDGLQVAMASSDPGFARAVSSAVAPVLTVSPADLFAGQGSARGDSHAQTAAGNGQPQQPRGQLPGRSDDRMAGQDPPPRDGEPRQSRRSGIFA